MCESLDAALSEHILSIFDPFCGIEGLDIPFAHNVENPVIALFGQVNGIYLPLFYPECEVMSDLGEMHQHLLCEKAAFAAFSGGQSLVILAEEAPWDTHSGHKFSYGHSQGRQRVHRNRQVWFEVKHQGRW